MNIYVHTYIHNFTTCLGRCWQWPPQFLRHVLHSHADSSIVLTITCHTFHLPRERRVKHSVTWICFVCLYAFQLNTEDFVYENVYKGSLVEIQCTVSSCFGSLEIKRAWQMEVSATPALTCGKLFCTCYTHYVRECETVKFTVSLGSFFIWIPLIFRMPSFHM